VFRTGVLATSLVDGPVLGILGGVSAAVFIVLVLRRPNRAWFTKVASRVAGGLGAGFLLTWLLGDLFNLWDVQLTLATRSWFSVAVAASAVAVANFRGTARWRKLVAGVGIGLFALTGAVGINADVGEFPTLGALVGREYSRLVLPPQVGGPNAKRPLWAGWRPPAGMLPGGRVGSAIIPGTVSGFHPRAALVYLPPAALTAHPPRLPVLVMLTGQPGGPINMFYSAQLGAIVDDFAREHRGLAPIVVVPDQLGASDQNPMCLDSPLGNAASYLTIDVPAWIRRNLNVVPGRTAWAIGGFSEGGTCAIQLGASHPELFGSIVDISGEAAPKRGLVGDTIRDAFNGSTQAYEAAKPSALLAAHAPYPDSLAIFGVGANDGRYRPGIERVAADARAGGMKVVYFDAPATAHDWHTVQYAIRRALPDLCRRWGLTG
jgi:S-formylglutathione hydrolase FrmB